MENRGKESELEKAVSRNTGRGVRLALGLFSPSPSRGVKFKIYCSVIFTPPASQLTQRTGDLDYSLLEKRFTYLPVRSLGTISPQNIMHRISDGGTLGGGGEKFFYVKFKSNAFIKSQIVGLLGHCITNL